jgi:hypothetical protein
MKNWKMGFCALALGLASQMAEAQTVSTLYAFNQTYADNPRGICVGGAGQSQTGPAHAILPINVQFSTPARPHRIMIDVVASVPPFAGNENATVEARVLGFNQKQQLAFATDGVIWRFGNTGIRTIADAVYDVAAGGPLQFYIEYKFFGPTVFQTPNERRPSICTAYVMVQRQ